MKRTFSIMLILLVALSVSSCNAARKPEQPQNRTFIIPEVSRVSFDLVELKSSPKVIRDIAKTVEDRDATTWAQTGGDAYLIISQGDKTRNYNLDVDEVLQRVPEQGFTWLDVRLEYSKMKKPRTTEDPVVTVVRADVTTAPKGVGFTITGLENAQGSTNRPPVSTPSQNQLNMPSNDTVIQQPALNQQITSPVRIQGTTKAQGTLRVRISTRGGQVIKEENLTPTPGTGAFSAEIKYSSPEMATPGEISIISTGTNEKTLARVPVVIK